MQSITIPLVKDSISEANETLVVRLVNPRDGVQLGTLSQTTETILDDDPGGEISFAAATDAVGEAKPSVVIGLRREKGLASGVGVSVCTGNGTATAGEDFEAVVTDLVFGASQVRLTNRVRIWQDPRAEGNETVSLRLANPRGGAVLGSVSNAWLTIADDEFSVQGIFKGSGSLSFHDCADRASNLSSLVSGEIHLFDVAPNRFSGKGALLAAYGPSTVLSLSGIVDGAGRLAGIYDSDISTGSFTGTMKEGQLLFSVKGQPTSTGCLLDCSLTATNYSPSGDGFAPASLCGLAVEVEITKATGWFPPPNRYRIEFSPTGYDYSVAERLGGILRPRGSSRCCRPCRESPAASKCAGRAWPTASTRWSGERLQA